MFTKNSEKHKHVKKDKNSGVKDILDIEDLSFNKKIKVEVQKKSRVVEPIKYELTNEEQLTNRDLHHEIQNNDEQGNIPCSNDERPSVNSNLERVFYPVNTDRNQRIDFDEERKLIQAIKVTF